MSSLAIRRLHLSTRRDRQWSARLVLERALARASLDERRLVLVRRGPSLDLELRDRGPFRQSAEELALAKRFSHELEPILATAVHGGNDAAARADAVWFADRHEALACYLALLAGGRRPTAWFWASALPNGLYAAGPLGTSQRLVDSLFSGSEDAASASRVVMHAARRASLSAVLSLLAKADLPAEWQAPPLEGEATTEGPWRQDDGSLAPLGSAKFLPLVPSLKQALACHPEFAAVLHDPNSARGRHCKVLAIAILLGVVRPEFAARGDIAKAIIATWTEETIVREPVKLAAGPPPSRVRKHYQAGSSHPPSESGQRPSPADESFDSATYDGDYAPHSASGDQRAEEPLAADLTDDMTGHRFPGAGLLLAIPALVRMGYPEWLEAKPDLIANDSARQLLLHVFGHYAPTGLPLAALLLTGNKRLPYGPQTSEVHRACLLWRKALDRWLRRTAKCRLHDLAALRGWLHQGVERNHVAFPLTAIQMGLRRRALDVDPGWVAWLGISLRYLFAEQPELRGVAG